MSTQTAWQLIYELDALHSNYLWLWKSIFENNSQGCAYLRTKRDKKTLHFEANSDLRSIDLHTFPDSAYDVLLRYNIVFLSVSNGFVSILLSTGLS